MGGRRQAGKLHDEMMRCELCGSECLVNEVPIGFGATADDPHRHAAHPTKWRRL